MKFNSTNGMTEFLMRTGKNSFVKNTMTAAAAKSIISNGEITESNDVPGFPICVNDTYFFPGVEDKRKYTKHNSEPTEQETDTKEDE